MTDILRRAIFGIILVLAPCSVYLFLAQLRYIVRRKKERGDIGMGASALAVLFFAFMSRTLSQGISYGCSVAGHPLPSFAVNVLTLINRLLDLVFLAELLLLRKYADNFAKGER